MKVCNAPIRRTYRIVSVMLPPIFRNRLTALGMVPDQTVRVLFRRRCGSCVLYLRGTRYAVGSLLCRGIEVSLP